MNQGKGSKWHAQQKREMMCERKGLGKTASSQLEKLLTADAQNLEDRHKHNPSTREVLVSTSSEAIHPQLITAPGGETSAQLYG